MSPAPTHINNFEEAIGYFEYLSNPKARKDGNTKIFAGGVLTPDTAIAKQTRFLELIGNPHLKIKMINIAGTSGKGSTTKILADSLISQGFKAGSSFSPHLVDLTDRIQINGEPISQELFLSYLNQILPAITQMQQENMQPSYFETLTALQFLVFADQKVDYAVMEVGMGGRLDATNVFVPNKICVLNSIGLDHTVWLGDTLELIANEKAGIIQKNNLVVALSQSKGVNMVFDQKAKLENADMDWVVPDLDFYGVSQHGGKVYFDYMDNEMNEQQIVIGMLGKYQATNGSLALRTLETIADRDEWEINWDNLKTKLITTKFKGRFDVWNQSCGDVDGISDRIIVIDSAHNQSKINGFMTSLVEYYDTQTKFENSFQFDFLVGFKMDKDYCTILDEILIHKNHISQLILTEFIVSQDSKIVAQDIDQIAQYLDSVGFDNYIKIKNHQMAWQYVLDNKKNTVVTGSMYLVGSIYKIFSGF